MRTAAPSTAVAATSLDFIHDCAEETLSAHPHTRVQVEKEDTQPEGKGENDADCHITSLQPLTQRAHGDRGQKAEREHPRQWLQTDQYSAGSSSESDVREPVRRE